MYDLCTTCILPHHFLSNGSQPASCSSTAQPSSLREHIATMSNWPHTPRVDGQPHVRTGRLERATTLRGGTR